MPSVTFDRIEKAWQTISGGGEDEQVEWPGVSPRR
jgi:hypothetical protein